MLYLQFFFQFSIHFFKQYKGFKSSVWFTLKVFKTETAIILSMPTLMKGGVMIFKLQVANL